MHTLTDEKNWHSLRPEVLPETWETKDLNFIPFSETHRSGWRAYSGFGKDYEIEQREGDTGKCTLTLGVNSTVSISREYKASEDAMSAAQVDFTKHLLYGFRVRSYPTD